MNSSITDKCVIGKTLQHFHLTCKGTRSEWQIHSSSTIHEVQNDWNELVPTSHELSAACCAVFEQCSPANISYRYMIACKDNEPKAAMLFQVIRLAPENLKSPFKNKFLRSAANLMLGLKEITVLVCGNVFKDGLVGFRYSNDVTNDEAADLLAKAISMLDDKEHFSAVMLKDVPEYVTFSSTQRVVKLEDDISMSFFPEASWKSIQEYYQSLSKKYAARARKIVSSFEGVTVQNLELDALKKFAPQLHALYKQVLQKQPFLFGVLTEDYFTTMKELMGSKFTVNGLFAEEELIGFYSTVEHDNELEVHYIGLNYLFNQSHNLYFNIHFLVLEQAILRKKKELNMGRTSLEAKAILGCKPHYNNTLLRFQCSLSEYAFQYFKKNVAEPDSWKSRNPLKQDSSKIQEAALDKSEASV